MIGLGFTISQQTWVFCWAILFGLFLGFLYDVVRIYRRAVHCGSVRVFFEDLLYFAFYTAATFLFLMGTCRGEFPPYILLGQFLGAVFWFCLPSGVFLRLGKWAIGLGKKFFSFLSLVFLYPLLTLSRKIAALFIKGQAFLEKKRKKLAVILRSDLKKTGELLYNQGEFVYGSAQAGGSAKRRRFHWNKRGSHRKAE